MRKVQADRIYTLGTRYYDDLPHGSYHGAYVTYFLDKIPFDISRSIGCLQFRSDASCNTRMLMHRRAVSVLLAVD